MMTTLCKETSPRGDFGTLTACPVPLFCERVEIHLDLQGIGTVFSLYLIFQHFHEHILYRTLERGGH
jgi:hypothetical protein